MNARSFLFASCAIALSGALAAAQANLAAAKPIVVRFVEVPFERLHAPGRQVNECAQHVRERQFALARGSCDRAVDAAQRLYERKPSYYAQRNLRGAQALAAALTNRASLELLTGNLERSQSDIALAMKLTPRHAFVERNQLVIEAVAGGKAMLAAR
jgi:hypothetical protein